MAYKKLNLKKFSKNLFNKMFLEFNCTSFLPKADCSKIIRTTKSRKSRGIQSRKKFAGFAGSRGICPSVIQTVCYILYVINLHRFEVLGS